MKLGEFTLTTVSGGRFRLDGGAMFGIIPQPLWSRVYPPDDRNRIEHDTNCVLVESPGRTVLIDTGYGSKLSAKEREFHVSGEGEPLAASLEQLQRTADDVGTVVLSHLHFDHAGGATRRTGDGALQATFPNAEFVVQRREWVVATAGFPELRGAYPQENVAPLEESGRLRLIDGDVEIAPGIRAVVTGGHTPGHQALIIESAGETAVYLGDVCPTTRHLPIVWGMAYDLDVLQLRRKKRDLLGQIADRGWLALFDHDPDNAAGRIARDAKRDFVLEEAIERL